MNRIAIAATILALAFASPVFASDVSQQPAGPGPDFKQRKAEMLKNLDERISGLQREKKCIQSANSPEDVRACRDKVRDARQKDREQQRKQREARAQSNQVPAQGGQVPQPQQGR